MSDTTDRAALVTGATGLLGSHVAHQLRLQGTAVYAPCRPGSSVDFLESIGVKIIPGDLGDPKSLQGLCRGVDVVYHAAARVGDWGPWEEFVNLSIEGTRRLLAEASVAKVRRFLHVSSISAYGHVNGQGLVLDESAPLGRHLSKWSYYSRAKVEAEKLVWKAHQTGQVDVTVIRPSWMYGPRDRATLPRLIDSIRRKRLKIIGTGRNRLNLVHAANVAQACLMAAQSEKAIGQAYNCCHDGPITQEEFFNAVADVLGEPPVTRKVPYALAHRVAFLLECWGHLTKRSRPPLVTRYSLWLMGRQCFFECRKIKEHLGWSSRISYEEGIPAAVKDYLDREKETKATNRREEAVNLATEGPDPKARLG